jgi:hypothetical protein
VGRPDPRAHFGAPGPRSRPAPAAAPIDADPLRIFASLARYLQNLLPFRLGSTVRNLPHAEAASLGYLLTAALTLAAAIALLAWLLRRRNANALGLRPGR